MPKSRLTSVTGLVHLIAHVEDPNFVHSIACNYHIGREYKKRKHILTNERDYKKIVKAEEELRKKIVNAELLILKTLKKLKPIEQDRVCQDLGTDLEIFAARISVEKEIHDTRLLHYLHPPFQEVPDDVIALVRNHLNERDRASLASVSKKFYDFEKSTHGYHLDQEAICDFLNRHIASHPHTNEETKEREREKLKRYSDSNQIEKKIILENILKFVPLMGIYREENAVLLSETIMNGLDPNTFSFVEIKIGLKWNPRTLYHIARAFSKEYQPAITHLIFNLPCFQSDVHFGDQKQSDSMDAMIRAFRAIVLELPNLRSLKLLKFHIRKKGDKFDPSILNLLVDSIKKMDGLEKFYVDGEMKHWTEKLQGTIVKAFKEHRSCETTILFQGKQKIVLEPC